MKLLITFIMIMLSFTIFSADTDTWINCLITRSGGDSSGKITFKVRSCDNLQFNEKWFQLSQAQSKLGKKFIRIGLKTKRIVKIKVNKENVGGYYSAADAIFFEGQTSAFSIEAFFTKPQQKEHDYTIRDKICDMIDDAKEGSDIYVSIYMFSDKKIRKAFSNAIKRKVSLSFVVDDTDTNNWMPGELKGANITTCKGDCLRATDGGINHNKFILFSKLKNGNKNVIIQTSHNFTNNAATKYQDLLVIKGAPELYKGYMDYWKDQQNKNSGFKYREIKDVGGVKAHFFPKRKGSDTVVDILNKVKCGLAGSEIHVGIAFFTKRLDIANKLVELHSLGCNVQAIVSHREKEAEEANNIHTILAGKIGSYKVLDTAQDKNYIHSKFLIINARFDDSKAKEKLIFTGSHNYTEGALKYNDETLLQIYNHDKIYDQYLDFWSYIDSKTTTACTGTPCV